MEPTSSTFAAECPNPPFYYKEASSLLPPSIPSDQEDLVNHYGSLFSVQQNQLKLDRDASSLKLELLILFVLFISFIPLDK